MLLQIRHVLATYIGHRIAMAAILLTVAFIIAPNLVATTLGSRDPNRNAQTITMVLGMPLFFVIPFFVGHVQTQFAHPRVRLIPRFLPAHLLTTAGILLTLTILFPSIIAICSGFSPVGLIALALAIAATAIWGIHFRSGIWMLISIATFYSLLTELGTHWWLIDAAQHLFVHVVVILACVGIVAAWLHRLSNLREEMSDYQRTMQWHPPRRTGGEVSEQRRLIAQQVQGNKFAAWLSDFWLSGIGSYHGNQVRGIVRLLRFGFGVQPIEVTALFMAGMFLAISVFMANLSYLREAGTGSLWFLLQMALIMPGVWAGQTLAARLLRMPEELLRPFGRRQYFDCLLIASAWNCAVGWLILNAAVVVAILCIFGGEVSPSQIAVYLLLAISIAVATFGAGVRAAIWKSLAARLAALLDSMFVFIVPMAVWWSGRDRLGDAPFIAAGFVFIGIGAALIASARRAWVNIEFA
ncbi:MAG: hypothetical protein U0805_23405 [Pirellulales bacterium]